jgi:hypothetical protein
MEGFRLGSSVNEPPGHAVHFHRTASIRLATLVAKRSSAADPLRNSFPPGPRCLVPTQSRVGPWCGLIVTIERSSTVAHRVTAVPWYVYWQAAERAVGCVSVNVAGGCRRGRLRPCAGRPRRRVSFCLRCLTLMPEMLVAFKAAFMAVRAQRSKTRNRQRHHESLDGRLCGALEQK